MAQTLRFIVVRQRAVEILNDPPLLSSRTGSYGVQTVADKETIVADSTPMEEDGLGWVYEIGDTYADDDEVLRYYVECVIDGVTYYVPRTTNFVKSASLVFARYTDSTQLELQFGVEELAKYLSVGDSEESIDLALAMSYYMDLACAWVDDELRTTLAVPYTDTIPDKIAWLATSKAGLSIYEHSGVLEIDPSTGYRMHRYAYLAKEIEQEIAKIKSGQVRLSSGGSKSGPIVVDCDE